ncbi:MULTISPECIES: hypothetical protein [unclassified Streptomyces]|uniref:hypothetical protein n=1 Tax=unclassified Streptomyces TaxID=2593676 RepID=UPI003D8B1161
MNHLIRRIAITGVSAAVVGGALLATEGSASALALPHSGPPRATVAVADTRYSPWIADQLALFVDGNGTSRATGTTTSTFATTAASAVSGDGRSGANAAARPAGVHVAGIHPHPVK